MSRVKSDKGTEALEKKLSRMEDQIKRSRRRVFSCFNCLVYLIIIILVIVGSIMYFLAKSGLGDVPVLSKMLFKKPLPTEVVAPIDTAKEDSGIVKKILAKAAPDFAQGKDIATVTLVFSQEYMTGALHDNLMKDPKSKIGNVQLAVVDDGLEFYLYREDNTYVKMIFVPEFINGKLKPNVTEVMLGNVTLPKGIGNLVLKFLISDALSSINKIFGVFGEIQDVQVVSDGVEVTFTVSKKSQLLNVF